MRTIAIGILALLAGGCAGGREFDLVPRDPQAPWQVGDHRVWTESSRASVSMAFDRPWFGYLVFDVEVVNRSDSALRVDPTHFSYSLASSDGQLPREVRRRFAALAPETAFPQLEKLVHRRSATGAITSFVATVVVLTAIAVNAVEFGDYSYSSDEPGGDACAQSASAAADRETFETVAKTDQRILDQAAKRLLRVTELAPGATVRGELWMPAWPVKHAVGPEKMANDPSITLPKQHAATYQGLTLHVPAEVGGQEFDYSIAVE